jgi:acetyltransferase-like isoleucine patch superfamily enzyme
VMQILHQIPKLRGVLVGTQSMMVARLYAGHFGSGLRVFGLPIVSIAAGSHFRVGSRAMLVSHPAYSEPGISHPCVLRTLSADSCLFIGDDVGMSGASIVAAKCVTIGNQVLIGADVFIADTDFHPVAPERRRWNRHGVSASPVTIGDNVFLGARAMILKGVTIGADSVVAAGSVVTDDVRPGTIVTGVPARPVGSVTERAE